MTDLQIEVLKHGVNVLKCSAWWIPDPDTARQITRIGKSPEKDEPTEVAFFHGGQYIALGNTDPQEIKSVLPYFS